MQFSAIYGTTTRNAFTATIDDHNKTNQFDYFGSAVKY